MSGPEPGRAANLHAPDLEREPAPEGFARRGAALAERAGAERLGLSLYELEPGEAGGPYHWHAANEELLLVLRGSVAVRLPDGWHEAAEGAVVAFPRGERGAHQVVNRSVAVARIAIASEMRGPDLCVYPDSDKLGAREAPPGSGGPGIRLNFRAGDAVDYWDGEGAPGPS